VVVLGRPLGDGIAVDLGGDLELLEGGIGAPDPGVDAGEVVVALPRAGIGLDARLELGAGALLVSLRELRHPGERPFPAGWPEDFARLRADPEHGRPGLGGDRAAERS